MNTTYEGSNRLMFITNRTDQYTEQQETQWVLEGGCRWIQLRMKDNPSLETARELVKLCAPYQARLCIDDDVQMALESGATAVHLGKNDMPVDQACELVHQSGKTDFLIGATANTFEDICHAARLGASYIGLGPFRFTQTKKKLSPILGLVPVADIFTFIVLVEPRLTNATRTFLIVPVSTPASPPTALPKPEFPPS